MLSRKRRELISDLVAQYNKTHDPEVAKQIAELILVKEYKRNEVVPTSATYKELTSAEMWLIKAGIGKHVQFPRMGKVQRRIVYHKMLLEQLLGAVPKEVV